MPEGVCVGVVDAVFEVEIVAETVATGVSVLLGLGVEVDVLEPEGLIGEVVGVAVSEEVGGAVIDCERVGDGVSDNVEVGVEDREGVVVGVEDKEGVVVGVEDREGVVVGVEVRERVVVGVSEAEGGRGTPTVNENAVSPPNDKSLYDATVSTKLTVTTSSWLIGIPPVL